MLSDENVPAYSLNIDNNVVFENFKIFVILFGSSRYRRIVGSLIIVHMEVLVTK